MNPDPFDTAALRAAVLRTWAGSPARFREDANAEEHLSIGYRGRVLAELAANAADAARAAGTPGEIVVTVLDGSLRVANTGAPLTSAGVAALAALRASAKRDEQGVGHFGVGFTAIRALTDEPVIVSTTGGVRFSAERTAAAVAELQVPELDAELRRRHGQVPALRLPWPEPPAADLPGDCVTEVRLPLRDGIDPDAVSAGWTVQTAMDLLWALPDLAAVTMLGRRVQRTADPDDPGLATITVTAVGSPGGGAAPAAGAPEPSRERRYRIQQAGGTLPPELLADRPVEERTRDRWRLTWVLPLDDADRPDPFPRSQIGAPTPTEEPTGLPAALVGTLPVEESRGRIAAGPLTDYLIDRAADGYAELVMALAPPDRPALLPPTGFPLGEVDAALTGAVADRLRRTAFLSGAGGAALRPDRASLVAGLGGPAAAAVAEAMPGLLSWPESPQRVERLRALDVAVQPWSAVTAALAQIDRPAGFWRTVYDGLAGAPTDDLADLAVPRRGGGTIVGPRGVLLPSPAGTPADGGDGVGGDLADRAALLLPGLRLAAVDHPLLRRLGAEPADPSAILNDPATAAEIRRRLDDLDDQDPDPADLREFAGLVLDLLPGASATDTAVLADVLLTDDTGEAWPAGSLLMPDSPLAALLVDDADLPVVASPWIAEYGPDLLARLGVRSGFAARRYPAPPGEDVDLPEVQDWWEQLTAAPDTDESFAAVPDLDLIADEAWPAALQMLAADRATTDALRPHGSDPSYTAWWLREHAAVDGIGLRGWRAVDATELAGLYDVLPVTLPPEVAADLGVLRTLADAAGDPAELLDRWADADRAVLPVRVPAITAALVAALRENPDPDLPDQVRSLTGAVLDADRAAVLDQPWLAQLLDPAVLVAGGADPTEVAEVLDLPLASERYPFQAVTDVPGTPTDLAALPEALRCLQACGREDLADRPVTVHPELAVRRAAGGDDAAPQRVSWWVGDTGVVLDGSAEGVARAVAHLAGLWPQRYRLVAAARADRIALAEAGLG